MYLRFFTTALSLFIAAATSFADSISNNPIVFVTMVPNPRDFGTLAATFGNHIPSPDTAFRGGDLWIRYPDGSLKNLTSAAGYGNAGFQGAGGIAVRDPSVHWDGAKVIFSMVVGAPTQQYQLTNHKWQLYEVTNLGSSQTPVITKVSNQPSGYNNHSPIYANDDTIIFVSDRPRDDSVLHIYPQRDEYESSPVNTGLWKLNSSTGALTILDHAPSGDFNPIIDSFGRVIFTRWDHLQRDQQNIGASLGAFNYESETSTTATQSAAEVFPEARSVLDPAYKSTQNLFTINQFFPWMMNQDGTDLETLNHVGRQEIGLYSERSFNDDPNVQEFYGQYSTGQNQNEFTIFLHIKESLTTPGTYLGVNCQEFGTHSSGQILSITGAPGVNPNDMVVTYLTHPDTAGATDTPGVNHSGLYRDPLPMTNGNILVSHTTNTRQDTNIGTSANPQSRYALRLKLLTQSGQYYTAGTLLTSGITKSVSFWNPDSMVSYSGELWETMPVELVSRVRPNAPSHTVPNVESQLLSSLNISESELKDYLVQKNLALIVSRNLTMRDKNDRQQPTNLRVTGTSTQSLPRSGKIYDISFLQIFQGDLIRSYTNGSSSGRRVLAQPMHSVESGINPTNSSGIAGSVEIAEDGSMAAFVPAKRALSWHMTDSAGESVVKERYWVTFQPGEIRVCASCHGLNTTDHTGKTEPQNSPLALAQLLAHWKNLPKPQPTAAPTPGGYSLTVNGDKGGKPFTVTASGGTASTKFQIKLKINGIKCRGTKNFAKSKKTLRGKYPKLKKSTVTFNLLEQGKTEVLATAKVSLSKSGSLAASSSSCKSLISSLK